MTDYTLDFEYTVGRFLGKKAYGIASAVGNTRAFRRHLRNCISVIRKRIDEIETTTKHKEILMSKVEELNELLKLRKGGSDAEIIVNLFSIIATLLGFTKIDGGKFHELFYYQTYGQYLWDTARYDSSKSIGNVSEELKTNSISLRKKIYQQLHKDGISDQLIANVLNTTEFHIRKLKRNI